MQVRDQEIGANLTVRIYTPSTKSGILSIALFLHGGGFVLGGLDMEGADCRYFCSHAQCILVSLEYPVAPETELNGMLEDCLVGYDWVSEALQVYRQ